MPATRPSYLDHPISSHIDIEILEQTLGTSRHLSSKFLCCSHGSGLGFLHPEFHIVLAASLRVFEVETALRIVYLQLLIYFWHLVACCAI